MVTAATEQDAAGRGRTWLWYVGVTWVGISMLLAVGPIGLAVAGVVLLVGLWLSGPYAVAGGHVAALPLLPNEPALSLLIGLEAGFLALLAAPLPRERDWHRSLALFVVLGAILGGIAWWGATTWRPHWLAGLVLVGLVAIGLYGVHRYSVVSLELEGVDVIA